MNATKCALALLASIILLAGTDNVQTHAQGLVEYALILVLADGAESDRHVQVGEDGFTIYGDGSATGVLTIKEPGRRSTYRIRRAWLQCNISVPVAQFEGILNAGNEPQSQGIVTIQVIPIPLRTPAPGTGLQVSIRDGEGQTYVLAGEGTLLINPCE